MDTISVRYIVDDIDAAIPFYTDQLGFEVDMHPAPGFAALSRGDLRLFLNEPGVGSGGKAGDVTPKSGGWNRIQVQVDDLEEHIERLREERVSFRGKRVEGRGGQQILVEDPSGNPIELFQPAG